MVDLVAFANADTGGWILVGVAEKDSDDGPCPGKVVGYEINRQTILTVLSKAQSCVPPVAIEMFPERHKKRSFLKVRIVPSPSKPHCTSSGLYCIRDGDRIRPLVPSDLLQQFMDVGAHLLDLHRDQTVQAFEGRLKMLSSAVRQEIAEAGRNLLVAGNGNGTSSEEQSQVKDIVLQLGQVLTDVDERVRELFRQDERPDPVDARYVKKFRTEIRSQLEGEAPEALQKTSEGAGIELSLTGKTNKELTGERVKTIFYDLVQEVLSERERGVG